jgi:capsular exopolysaccharide synthesis family protein
VEVKRLSELIRITVEDTDPTTAAVAVTAIVNSYQTLYNEQDERLNRNRLNKLESDHKDLEGQIKQVGDLIQEKAQEYGTTNLEVFFTSAFGRVSTIEQALDKINIAIANAPAAAAATNVAPENVMPETAPDPLVIAMTDGTMRSYLEQQDQRLLELQRLKKSYPDTNDKVVVAMENLERAKLRVTNYAEMYRLFHKATSQNLSDPGRAGVVTAGQSVEKLKENAATLVKMLSDTRAEMRSIGVKQLEFEKLSAQLTKLKGEFDDVGKRMDTLKAERSLGTRLSIISTGEVPLSPSTDKRIRMAAIAGFGGFLLPAALVFGLSFVRRRYRFVDDTAKDSTLLNVPLLGMLPEVGRKFDAEVLHATAHGIHQMRVLLCAKTPRNSKRSYLITSATEGEGKTNLTVALGMSFAAARQRTLVIDCDFVGRRLTRGFKAEKSEGVFEAMRDGTLINRVRQEGPRLFVLPTGRVDSTHACGITTENIRDLLEQTRGQFDTVIIDTGPILGSLEAAVVAQEVDGVILTISRGQHPTLVQHALQRLESVNAVLAGAVFNRAKLQDFHSSAYTSSHNSTPFTESLSIERTGESTAFADFGPLVRAVSMATPAAA